MMIRKILLLTLVLLPMTLLAAIPDMKFRRLDTRDGLSNSQVLCVYRDRTGVMWIGTPYGLNRYDGYRIKTYYSDMRDTTTLRSNYVDDIFEAADGKLWLKQGMGYSIFDPQTERCDRRPERWLEKWGLTGGIEFLYIDSQKDFWVKSYNDGFFHYNPQTKKLHQYRFGYSEQDFNADIGVSSLAERGDTVFLSSNNGEVLLFSRKRDLILDKEDYLRKNRLASNQQCKLRIDDKGNVWVIAIPMVYVWNPKTDKWIVSIQEVLRSLGVPEVPAEMPVWDMQQDARQRYWLATDHGGLYVVDRRTQEMRQYLTSKYDETSISDNTLRNIYMDQLGRAWIGSYQNGLNQLAGNTSYFRNMDMGNINTICYDKFGYTWLGTNDKGIIRHENVSNEQVIFDKANSGIGSNTMVGSLAASDGSVWFGTYEGGLIHIKNGQVKNYRAIANDTTGLVNNNVWTVCEDQWGNIWIGTLGGGVQRIDKRTGKMRTFNMSNSNLASDYISTITRTKKGWLMVSHSKFYSLINPKTFQIVNRDITKNKNGIPITETSITAMEDSRGLAWQGSTAGATIWDPKTNEVYLIDMRSGLFGSTVNGIAEDDKHTMWLVTDHGISNVIPQKQADGRYTFVVRSYNNRDGLQNGPYNQRSVCFTSLGLLLVGGQGGLDALRPANLGKDRVKEVPIFSGLLLFDEEVPIGKKIDGRLILKTALNDQRELTMKYSDQFTIQLASNNGEIHNRSRFIYQLEGFNDNWVRTTEVNPNISYMSLHYGDYTLHVRMLNDDGTMGEDEATLEIHISTPFYRTRWAMLLCLLLIVGGVWWWRRYMLRTQAERMKLEQQRRELEKTQWMNEMREQLMKDGVTLQKPEQPQPEEKLTYYPRMENIVEFVRSAVNGFKMPEDKACKLSFHTSLNRMTINFDPALMARMLDILIGNSVRFSPRGSRIKIKLEKVDNMAELRVADRGLGIPEEARANMFNNHGEDGIGLDIIKRIVDFHGGSVHAEDNPHGGTIFVVQLPADNKPADDEIPVEEAIIIE
jgi:ligand-binding sensor domain-containing protein